MFTIYQPPLDTFLIFGIFIVVLIVLLNIAALHHFAENKEEMCLKMQNTFSFVCMILRMCNYFEY